MAELDVETRTVLLAADLDDLATGGIYTYEETRRNGLGRTATPNAFDSNGIIRPTILIKLRDSIPTNDLIDGVQSLRRVIELWFYASDSFVTIAAMRDAAFSALHEEQLPGTFQVLHAFDVRDGYDEDLDALCERSDYAAFLMRRKA